MAWDGSGNVERTNGTNSGPDLWEQDKSDSTKILASLHDAHDQDLADMIENCLTIDGQNSPSSDISWGGQKITNLGDGTALAHAVNFLQLVKDAANYCGSTSGTSTAYTASFPVNPGSYFTGMRGVIIPHVTNGPSPTINFNALGAKDLAKSAGSYINNGYFVANTAYQVVYDGTRFLVLGAAN